MIFSTCDCTRQRRNHSGKAGRSEGLLSVAICTGLASASGIFGIGFFITVFIGTAIGAWMCVCVGRFFAAIIGGFNNSRGALLGGLIVGVCENLAAAYISPAYKDAVALVIFMVVILFKPQGLLGKKEERKV